MFNRIGCARTEAQGLRWFRYGRPLPIFRVNRKIVGYGHRLVLDHGSAANHRRKMYRVIVISIMHALEEIAAIFAKEFEIRKIARLNQGPTRGGINSASQRS